MPKYRVTSPDGGTFEVTAPDGATPDQVMAYARENMGPKTAAQKYQAEDAATAAANERANPLQQFATGAATQAGRTLLGVGELANNLSGDRLFDPEVLAEAQREADRRDEGTGVAGFAGNLLGDFRNFVGAGAGANAALKANTLRRAAVQGAKVGAVSGAATGLTEATGDADSDVLAHARNAGIGGALGAGVGAAAPALTTGAKKSLTAAAGGVDRGLAFAGSDAAASRVAYRNIADQLLGQGYQPGEVAAALDAFKAQGIDGGTLGQMLRSSDLLAREKNLLQGGGVAARVMGQGLDDQKGKLTAALLAKAEGLAQPDQTSYLYRQAAELADAAAARGTGGTVTGMGQSRTARELPFTVNAIEQDLADKAAELPAGVVAKIQRYLAEARADGGFAAHDKLKQKLDDLYKDASLTTDQDTVNEAVLGYRRMLNDALEWAGGDPYRAAKRSAKRDLAGREMADAAGTTKVGGVRTALNKFFGSPEQRAEFLRKLPDDAARRDFEEFLARMEAVSGTFGGSDTASNTATRKAMAGEAGLGFDPDLNPATLLDRATAPLQRRVRKAQAEATFAADGDKLQQALRRYELKHKPPGVASRLAAKEAAKAATPTRDEPLRVTVRPQPDLPPVDLPQVRGPQDPLLDKMARAESSNNPDAKNPHSSASGLMQFTDGTWKEMVARYGKETGITLADKADPQAQRTMAARYARQNLASLQTALGRTPTKGELYMAHVLGANGSQQLIRAKASPKPAAALYPAAVVTANRALFYDGPAPRSAAQLYALLERKVS